MAGEIGSFLGGFSGSTIGTAVVKMYLDESAYNADLAKTSAATATQTGKMGGALTALKGIGVLAYAAIGTAAVSFAADAIAAAREHEVAVTRLRDAVGNAADSFEDQATALQQLSGFSDEAIIDATTLLSKYDLTASQLRELNPLVVDYARFTGKDVATAAGDLGKALLGNTRALKAVGVEYVATGNRTRDLATLMAALEAKVGGAAAAFGETSEGKAAKLRESFEELKEAIGEGLLPTLDSLTESIQGLADIINSDGLRAVIDMGERIRGLASYMFTGRLEFKKFTETIEVGSVTATQSADEIAEAIENAGSAAGKSGRQLVRFADLTGKELHEWSKDVIDNIRDTFGTLTEFDNQFTLTANELEKNAERSRKQTERFAEDIEKLGDLHVSDEIKKALIDEGIAAVDAFVRANAEGRRNIVDDIKAQLKAENEAAKGVKDITGLLEALGKTEAKATVNIEYKTSGIPLDVLKSLPGMDEV